MMKTFVVFCGLLAFAAAQQPYICTATTIEYDVTINGISVLTYTSTLHTKELQGSPMTQLFVTDETFTSVNSSLYYANTDGIYTSIGNNLDTRCVSIGGYCSWLVGNETVEYTLSLNLGQHKGIAYINRNVIDQNEISRTSGEFFTQENSCEESTGTNYPFDGYVFNTRQCCKDFQPVPPPLAEHPKCMKFNSTANFYNNGRLFVAVNATFNLTDTGFNMSSSSFGPIKGSYSISQNQDSGYCGGILGGNATCNSVLPDSDFKVIFPVIVRQVSGQSWQYTATAGRLISRNGIHEKEEGIRYTEFSPCLEESQLYKNNTIYAFSRFCCTEFEKS